MIALYYVLPKPKKTNKHHWENRNKMSYKECDLTEPDRRSHAGEATHRLVILSVICCL